MTATCGAMVPRGSGRGRKVWWRRCRAPLAEGKRVCDDCAEAIADIVAEHPVTSADIAAAIVEAEATPGRERRERAALQAAERDAERRAAEATSVVYYLRLGVNHIKIGTTQHLRERMVSLRCANPDNLLAVEPGGYDLEQHRHDQFHRWRYQHRREDFAEAPELLAHITTVRAEHGDPWTVGGAR